MDLICAKSLLLEYKNSAGPALKNVSFTIEKGRITQFLGKSGSGKTTLLKCIANLNHEFSGTLTYKDQAIKAMSPKFRATHIGYVAQSFDLFPHMSVLENCTHPQINVLKRSKDVAEKTAQSRLNHLGMADFLTRSPKELSGGQKQRVSIARALCMDSRLLLLDEPTSALDPESSKNLVEILRTLNQEGVTIALSTHDMTFSKNLLDRVYFMMQGEIIEYLDTKSSNLADSKAIKNFFDY